MLRFTSRDAAEHDTAVSFDGHAWTELGSAAEYAQTQARSEVRNALADLGGTASLTEIAELAGREKGNTLRLLRGMREDGLVYQEGERGPWKLRQLEQQDNSEAPQVVQLSELFSSQQGIE